ncbi:MAG: histidine phosphatase family protein [Myxococcota bacterium]
MLWSRRIAVLALPLVMAAGAACASEAAWTQVILVRHAEKVDASKDPDLSPAGERRARALAAAVRAAGVRTVYATQWKRTQETVAPLVAETGVPLVVVDAHDVAGLCQRIRTQHAGQVVLVAAHSNTLPEIVAGLGAPPIEPLGDDAYDNLYVVTLGAGGRASVLRLKYVVPADAP